MSKTPTATTRRDLLRGEIRERLELVASQANQAKRLRPENDNLLDLIDSIDNDIQAVIEMINRVRRWSDLDGTMTGGSK